MKHELQDELEDEYVGVDSLLSGICRGVWGLTPKIRRGGRRGEEVATGVGG